MSHSAWIYESRYNSIDVNSNESSSPTIIVDNKNLNI